MWGFDETEKAIAVGRLRNVTDGPICACSPAAILERFEDAIQVLAR